MKKFLCTALLALIGFLAFAQDRIAVFPFEDMDNIFVRNEAVMFYREFSNEFANIMPNRYVVPRQDVERLINTEMSFQLSNFSAQEKTAEMNRVLNGTQILSGYIGRVGNNIRITVSLFTYPDLRQLPGGVTKSVSNTIELFDIIPELVQDMQNKITDGNTSSNTDTRDVTYNIGDYGPAGGIVFYDKGIFSNGWRYLEAAPAETEFTAQWGARGQDVSGTGTAVGSGKRNTELIVERLIRLGETGRAAQLCDSLNFDGFNDWFLPSKDELDLMYQNLKQKGLGGFNTSQYWSSSHYNNISAWSQIFSNGRQFNYESSGKFNEMSVRAVRAF